MLSNKITAQTDERPWIPFIYGRTAGMKQWTSEIQWLAMENALHKRLANVVDLDEAIDGFSVWLSQLVPHDLIGFADARGERVHFFCSSHGPNKNKIISLAKRIIGRRRIGRGCEEGFFITREIRTSRGRGLLLVFRSDSTFKDEEIELIEKGVEILEGTLERVLYYEILYHQSRIDALTGIPNRRVFQETVEQAMQDASRYGRKLSLAILDLDNFKEINDTLGHDAGDDALKRVAMTISGMIRSTDLLARVGGDEFVLLMPNTDLGQAKVLIQRIIEAVNGLDIHAPRGKKLGISIGLSQWDGGSDLESWMKLTDGLLYRAKNGGRNCCIPGGTGTS